MGSWSLAGPLSRHNVSEPDTESSYRTRQDGLLLPKWSRRCGQEDEPHAVHIRRVAGGLQGVGLGLEEDSCQLPPRAGSEVHCSQVQIHHREASHCLEVQKSQLKTQEQILQSDFIFYC